ncbi:MAG: alcohol dehydrogenase catalytic domain-containing protein [Actinomycetota bacterium]|nr:alcohol dehydrogenase catalytic domain-containing protein [Actinomycetota bacterium]
MKGKMRAQLFYGPGDIRYEHIDIPDIRQDEVLVRIKSALTCGSDLKTYKRGHPTMIKESSVFGHEWAGDIVEKGGGVKKFEVGDRIVSVNTAPCGSCFYCRLGRYSLCENLVYNNGAYAEYIKVPANILDKNTFRIPEGIKYREAALLEPLSCVVHGVEESRIRRGDTVVINGAGPIGLMFAVLAKLKGAVVISVDLSDERLGYAAELGADYTVNGEKVDDQVKAVKKLTGMGRGADIAIDATGLPEVWEMTVPMGRKGALINLFGGCLPGTSINIDTALIHYSEFTIKGVYHHTPYYVKKAFALITSHSINAAKFITADMPLEKLADALKLMDSRKGIKYNILT